ncbi:hypothetical protein DPMN_188842 [Dreissena polymorpha]|uniref:Uncharacterized protein n=1 Tax=Dreissena polymorpha TaxID=45954 RepID=A0A9D4IAF2_DREPO|nr:hypothetical protein DPMN_188842 [Dreissena polymorpha]
MLNITYTKQQTLQTWEKDTSSQGEYDAEPRGSMMLNVTYTKQQTSQTWEKDTSSQGEYNAERHLHQTTDITDLGEGYL